MSQLAHGDDVGIDGAARFLRPAVPRPDIGRTLQAVRKVLPEVATLRQDEHGRVVGRFYGSYITTAFQAWRRPNGSVVAQEAYARSHSRVGEGLSPWRLFAGTALDSELVALDRLCRTVHALNFFTQADDCQTQAELFVNVDARLLTAVPERHGEFFGKILGLLDVAPQRIVIDIPLNQRIDARELRQAIASYWRNGFRVALNAENIVHARALSGLIVPDYLMLDSDGLTLESLQRLTQDLARIGSQVIVKRIENAGQLEIAAVAGVTLVQGFHLDRASALSTEK